MGPNTGVLPPIVFLSITTWNCNMPEMSNLSGTSLTSIALAPRLSSRKYLDRLKNAKGPCIILQSYLSGLFFPVIFPVKLQSNSRQQNVDRKPHKSAFNETRPRKADAKRQVTEVGLLYLEVACA